MEESTTPSTGLGSDERLASMVDGSAAVPQATAGIVESSRAEAGVAGVTLESRAEKPTVPKEQTTLPKASEGMVGHAIRPPSPQVVPPATMEVDKVEEIERDEP